MEQLLAAFEPLPPRALADEPRLTVHAAVSRFAVLYERIRNAVDYKDEHLLRKAAILRILNRHFILEVDPKAIALNLIRELIGARYIPNGELPERIVDVVAEIVQKEQAVERCRVGSAAHYRWLRTLIAVEIEETLVDATREKTLTTWLYEQCSGKIRSTADLSETDLRIQIYLACHRTFLKADDDMLAFKLMRAFLSDWLRPASWIESPLAMAERLVGVERRIRLTLRHPMSAKIQRAVKPWAVAFRFLTEAMAEPGVERKGFLGNTETMHAAIRKIVERDERRTRGRLRRGAVRAIIYIFLTKMLLAFAVEVPVERIIYSRLDTTALGVNLLFPPVLMAFVALFIRVPGKMNTDRILSHADTLLSSEGIPLREVRQTVQRRFWGSVMFGSLYALLYIFIFGSIGMVLSQFHFTWVSIAIFLFFLCTVSFFAYRLRLSARENVIVHGKESLRSALLDAVSLPILRVGHWLSRGISRLNVFLFFFDFLLEAPFKILLSVFEEWLAFLKEKKEELQ